jgi:ankyrin repeat protein
MKLIYETNMDILPWTFMSRNIHDACAEGRTIEVEEMCREGADINDSDEFGNTPLWLAYISGHLDTVFALLELNVDINRRTGTILASDFHRACGWADEVFIDILCNYNANLNLTDRKKPRNSFRKIIFFFRS